MTGDNELYSPYIESGIIKKDKYRLFSYLVKMLFNRIELDEESVLLVKTHEGKGKIVYASMQTSYTSLYILINLLKKHSLPVPELALGFVPYTYQKFLVFYKEAAGYLKKVLKSREYIFIPNHEYIERALDSGSISFSLMSRKLFIRRYVQIKTDVIEYLLELQKKTDDPVFIFPQVVFWNRDPEKSGTLFRSEAAGDRGIVSGIFTTLKSITPAFVRIGRPVNLQEVLQTSDTDDIKHLARQIRNSLMEIYNYEKRSIIGPQIKTQQEMMEKVLYHKNVMEAIQQEINEKGVSEKELRKKAYSYFREIAADFSIMYIRLFKATLDYFFKKLFNNIHYDIEGFKKIREASTRGPLVLVPSHKSHMDYLIISCMFYQNKMIPPHIWSGSNLTFFSMGKIFRRSGAFFVRRSFKGMNLYAAVIKQYIKSLVNEGYTIEIFIEGGRSRTGKVIHPKMGTLKYLLEAVDEGYNKDLVFAPITVNYDRILEENSYLKELKGKEKTKETTSSFIKSRKLIKRKYGSVYMGFSDPFTLSEVREKFLKENKIKNTDNLIEELGYHIVRKINDAVIATPFSVITLALLSTTARGFTRDVLRKRIDIILTYLAKTDYMLADILKDAANLDTVMDLVFESYAADDIINRTDLTTDPGQDKSIQAEELYVIDHEQRGRINFYKNSIIHMILPVSMISLAILSAVSNKKISRSGIISEFKEIRDTFSRDFVYQDMILETENAVDYVLSYLSSEKIIKANKKDISFDENGAEVLKFFAGMILDYIESYMIVLNAVIDLSVNQIPRNDLVVEIRKTGTKMYHLSVIQCSESLSMINYNNTLDKLIETGILQQTGDPRKAYITVADRGKASVLKNVISTYILKIQGT